MEVDFLNDPKNSHLFENEEDTRPAPRPKEPKVAKKKQASSKRQCNEPSGQKKKKKKEPELATVVSLYAPPTQTSPPRELQSQQPSPTLPPSPPEQTASRQPPPPPEQTASPLLPPPKQAASRLPPPLEQTASRQPPPPPEQTASRQPPPPPEQTASPLLPPPKQAASRLPPPPLPKQTAPRRRTIPSPYHSPSLTVYSPASHVSPASLLSRRPPAARSLFSSGYESSMETSRHISSLLRDFESVSEPDLREYLEKIDRQQNQCIAYQKLMFEKINLLVDLVTRVPETPPSSDFLPSVTSVRSDHEPATFAKDTFPVSSAQPQNTPTTSQHELVHSPVTDSDIISQDELFAIRSKATSVKNFAVRLIRALFKPEELRGKNVKGVLGKQPLNTEKLEVIKKAICKFYPAPPDGRDSQWRECSKAVDTFLRGLKFSVKK